MVLTRAEIEAKIEAMESGFRAGFGSPNYVTAGEVKHSDTIETGLSNLDDDDVIDQIRNGTGKYAYTKRKNRFKKKENIVTEESHSVGFGIPLGIIIMGIFFVGIFMVIGLPILEEAVQSFPEDTIGRQNAENLMGIVWILPIIMIAVIIIKVISSTLYRSYDF